MKIIYILILMTFLKCPFLIAQNLITREVATNFDTPWELIWGVDNHIWITERYGMISRLDPESKQITQLLKISDVFEDGERGLMGMVLHPNFFDNPFVYIVYTYGNNNSNTKIKIVRLKYANNSLNEPQIIIDNIKGYWNHDGSRLWIDKDLKLWFTIGDAAVSTNSQDLSNLNGKLCRINLDGTIPPDNPFANSAIWSYGHRNQQGIVFIDDKIFTSEHGASTDDEINLIQKGRNYGWPNVEGYCNTSAEKTFCQNNNVVEPILSLTPESTYAIAGIDYYNSDIIPEWKNSILITSLKKATLTVAKLNNDKTSITQTKDFFAGQFGRLRDVCVAPNGKIYIATSNLDGRGIPKTNDDKIIEISPENTNVEDGRIDDTFKVYPNPSNNYIDFELLNNKLSEIEIINTLGQKVNELTFTNNFSWDLKDYSNSKLPIGVYFLILKNNPSIRKQIILN